MRPRVSSPAWSISPRAARRSSFRPVARLVPLQRRRPVAEAFRALRGEIELADDFDELSAELAEHFR
jgi:antitoxin (DNA-binding transcriptional repressor) of toxin-antitoxin stability system